MKHNVSPQWLSMDEACLITGMCEEKLIELAESAPIGQLSAAGKIRYNRYDLENAVAKNSFTTRPYRQQSSSGQSQEPTGKSQGIDISDERKEIISSPKNSTHEHIPF